MPESSDWLSDIEGNFPLHKAVVEALPKGVRVHAANAWGTSSWSRTAKLTASLADGTPKAYFLKCAQGEGARAQTAGEHHSTRAIAATVADLVPEPVGWGVYLPSSSSSQEPVYFYLSSFHRMDFGTPPDPAALMSRVAAMHATTSPHGHFGYPVATAMGAQARAGAGAGGVPLDRRWDHVFGQLLLAAMEAAGGSWPPAYRRVLGAVVPRLLRRLRGASRPALVHGDLWERNVGVDAATGKPVLFDAGCVFAPAEFEFATWRCAWATWLRDPRYLAAYEAAGGEARCEPREEWDDRQRLYALVPYLVASAGHPEDGKRYRECAYNDMLYLCEKYAPDDELEKYDPAKDLTGVQIPFVVKQME
ncbi:Fructosamine kinase-domain-containing protein [Xylariomycetidae sp. FL0641]|nr:Fructosamine kinase-domain-containing protein [Xylariomycetidae sp. FL0641]